MTVADAPTSDAVVVRNLRIELVSSGEDIVDEIVLEVTAGQVLGLVGESGSGKTTVGMALLGYTRPGGKVVGGDVVIEGQNLEELHDRELRAAARRHRRLHPPGPRDRAQPGPADRAAAVGDARGSLARDERRRA